MAGSVVSSLTSTTRRYGFFASCLRSKILTSSAVTSALTAAVIITRTRNLPALRFFDSCTGLASFCSSAILNLHASSRRPMSNAGVTMHAGDTGHVGGAALHNVVHEVAVTFETI